MLSNLMSKGQEGPSGACNDKVSCYYCRKWVQTQPWRRLRSRGSLWRGEGWVYTPGVIITSMFVLSHPWQRANSVSMMDDVCVVKIGFIWCTPPPPLWQRLTVVLALATLISAFGSSFQYGYNVAVVNSPSPVTQAKTPKLYSNTQWYRGQCIYYDVSLSVLSCSLQFMQQFYNTTYVERYGRPMEDNFLTLLWSLSVSMYPLGGFFGSLMVAPLVNKLGR